MGMILIPTLNGQRDGGPKKRQKNRENDQAKDDRWPRSIHSLASAFASFAYLLCRELSLPPGHF